MDQLILAAKLESLRRCLQRSEDKKPVRLQLLIENEDIQDILVLNLTLAVQICADIKSLADFSTFAKEIDTFSSSHTRASVSIATP